MTFPVFRKKMKCGIYPSCTDNNQNFTLKFNVIHYFADLFRYPDKAWFKECYVIRVLYREPSWFYDFNPHNL